MKNLSLMLNGILIVAVSILFYLQFAGNSPEKKIVAHEPTLLHDSSSYPLKDIPLRQTAYIHTDSLFEKFLFVKNMRDELAAEKLKYESNYENELKKLEKEVYDFRDKAPYMSQQEGESKQLELAEKEQKLMKLERDLSAKLGELEIEKNKQIQKAVIEYLEKLNKEKNYAYIFGYNGMGNVLYAHPVLDITEEVVTGLNREFSEMKRR